jgi:hypothetical protein
MTTNDELEKTRREVIITYVRYYTKANTVTCAGYETGTLGSRGLKPCTPQTVWPEIIIS